MGGTTVYILTISYPNAVRAGHVSKVCTLAYSPLEHVQTINTLKIGCPSVNLSTLIGKGVVNYKSCRHS